MKKILIWLVIIVLLVIGIFYSYRYYKDRQYVKKMEAFCQEGGKHFFREKSGSRMSVFTAEGCR